MIKKIGMPPGSEPSLDTVPSADSAQRIPSHEPIPVTRLAGVAPLTRTPAPDVRYALELPDGTRRAVGEGVIVGRDPLHQPGYGVDELASLHDTERSVSKTHAVLRVATASLWVTDLNSTNGTRVVEPGGSVTVCSPEVPVVAPLGHSIRFGDFSVRVVAL